MKSTNAIFKGQFLRFIGPEKILSGNLPPRMTLKKTLISTSTVLMFVHSLELNKDHKNMVTMTHILHNLGSSKKCNYSQFLVYDVCPVKFYGIYAIGHENVFIGINICIIIDYHVCLSV